MLRELRKWAYATPRRSTLMILLLLTVLGGALRGLVLEKVYPLGLVGDERYYVSAATNIADGRGHVVDSEGRAFRPPAHSFALSLIATGDDTDDEGTPRLKRFLLLEVFLGTLLVPLTGLLGWSLFDQRTGIVAALITSVYPSLVAFSHFLWSETLFAVLVTASLVGIVHVERTRSWLLAAVTGVGLGVAALTREVAIPIAVIGCFWWLLTAAKEVRRKAITQGALMIVVMSAVVMPWTMRNYVLFDRLVPVGAVGWFAIREGNTFTNDNWIAPDLAVLHPFRLEYFAIADEMERMDFARREALVLIREAQPYWFFKKLVRTVTLLTSPDCFLFKKASRGAYGDIVGWVFRVVLLATITSYLVVAGTSALGILGATTRNRRSLLVMIFGVVFCIHLLANSSSRFRIGWMPLLVVCSSHALCRWRSMRHQIPRAQLVSVSVVTIVLLAWSFAFFYPDAVHLWQHATYVDPGRP